MFLRRIGEVADIGCPVIDGLARLGRIAGVVAVERFLRGHGALRRGRFAPVAQGRILRIPLFGVVSEEIAHVVDHDVLDQIHALAMQPPAQVLHVAQAAVVLVHGHQVLGPVAVITAVLGRRTPPLVAHRRCDPDGCSTQIIDIAYFVDKAGKIAAGIMAVPSRVVFTDALVVVGGIAVIEAVQHHEIDDLLAPIRRGDMQFAGTLRIHIAEVGR